MDMKKGKQAVIEQFLADGINIMFGNPGTSEEGFLDILENYPNFKYISTLQESVAVAMADGYARKTKKPTVVQLHSGVGLGNGVGMIYQAMRGHAPLVIVAGEAGIKYDATDSQMAADLVSIAKPVTKWATRVVDSSSLLRVLKRAIKTASTPPMGPVFICLPLDILDMPITEEITPTSILNTRTFPEENALIRCTELLANANHPTFIIGDGIAFSGAQEELERMAGLVGAEVWGAEFSETNISASSPHFKGLLGHMFGENSKAALEKADVVFISGTYLFPEVFPLLKDAFSPETKLIHVDLNSYEIAKNFNVDIGIVSDPKLTIKKLSEMLDSSLTPQQKQAALKRNETLIQEKKNALEASKKKDESLKNNIPLHLSVFAEELSKHIPKETVIFDEALTYSPELNRYIPPDVPGYFFQTRGGSLGVGIPGAMGIKMADPKNTVIGFSGDGGSMYTIQALWTAAHYNIDAKFVICNNHSYRLLVNNLKQYRKERGISEHQYPESFYLKDPNIDFVKISESMGVPAIKVEKQEQIIPAIQRMLGTNGPFLIDLIIE